MQTLRVLCFHGARQDGEFFRHKVSRLLDGVNKGEDPPAIAPTYVDGPWLMPLEEGDTTAMRCWYEPYVVADEGAATTINFASDPARAFEHLLQKLSGGEEEEEESHFDILLGSSQGALLVLDLLRVAPDVCARIAPALKAVVLFGCPPPASWSPPSATADAAKFTIPSIHFVGEADRIVPAADSLAVAARLFADPVLRQHPHGHIVPSNAKDVECLRGFLWPLREPLCLEEAEAQLADEVAQLELVFGTEVGVQRFPPGHGRYTVAITIVLVEEPQVVHLVIQCPPGYPAVAPTTAFCGVPVSWGPGRRQWEAAQTLQLCELAESLKGAPMMLPLFMAAKDAVEQQQDHVNCTGAGTGDQLGAAMAATSVTPDPWSETIDTPELRERLVREADVQATQLLAERDGQAPRLGGSSSASTSRSWATRRGGGDWKFVIGLVGKPSAGKSTFFNAITNPQSEVDAAKIGAFPFTTIEPNYGTAFVGFPCPCGTYCMPITGDCSGDGQGTPPQPPPSLSSPRCNAIHGHLPQTPGEPLLRRMPVTIKDVAGLVKGAYQGKGKGNRFLNDLCDADVLIHVVDGAGATTREGDAADEFTAGDPLDDVQWVRDEIHNWIFDNVRARWSVIQNNPAKLLTMFSGYHARSTLVEEALALCGVNAVHARELAAKIPTWAPKDLHLLVAVFVAMRFPILLGVNKLDLPQTPANVAALAAKFPHYPIVAMSAHVECALLRLRSIGAASYIAGDSSFELVAQEGLCAGAKHLKAVEMCKKFFGAQKGALRTTGVTEALRCVVAMRPALMVFPVDDLATLAHAKDDRGTSGGSRGESSGGAAPSVLQRCLLMKPDSTVDDVFDTLFHEHYVGGKFVRCEGIGLPLLGRGDGHVDGPQSRAELPRPVILRRDDVITHPMIVKIMANRLRSQPNNIGGANSHGSR